LIDNSETSLLPQLMLFVYVAGRRLGRCFQGRRISAEKDVAMGSLQIGYSRLLELAANSARQKRSFSNFGLMARYAVAVPFLAVGAALMTVGALIAGTSTVHRVNTGRITRGPRVPRF
jgi:hypothetical protein